VKLPDDVWQVVADYLRERRGIVAPLGLREWAEQNLDITLFDGGAILAKGNEFDLFVVPEKRGKWRIRSVIGDFLDTMLKKHEKIVVKIYEDNTPSLRLARGFGFKDVGRENGMIRLEKRHG
jgi:RimJ/RimL family protein N-acetyltransferase